MPTAVKPVRPKTKSPRRPSAAARSESALSRRSSQTSFRTAAGVSDYTKDSVASEYALEDDDDQDLDQDEQEHEVSTVRDHEEEEQGDDDADETETISKHHSPKREHNVEDEEVSSNGSASPPHLFNQNSGDELNKSPPTSHDDATISSGNGVGKKKASRALDLAEAEVDSAPVSPTGNPKHSQRDLLSPSPTPKQGSNNIRTGKGGARSSLASHLTLPYQRSNDTGVDYLDSSRRLSKMTSATSGIDSRRASSRAGSYLDVPDFEMRDSSSQRFRSQSERGGGTNRSTSRLLAPIPDFDRASSRLSSYQGSLRGGRGPGSRYASSLIEPSNRSPGKRSTLLPPPSGIGRRGDADNMSVLSRSTAKKPASVFSKILDADFQVFTGTRIRKFTEPPLTEAMRRVMKQFQGHHMLDHRCKGYPIAVFVGATAIDTGSIINPHISGGVSLYFGPGHPKNMASILPAEDRVPRHIPNPKAPTPTSLSRRAELRSAITALQTIFELYRGRACAHICIDSAYVAKAWGTWIPTWELKGWPGEDDDSELSRESDRLDEEYEMRRRERKGERRIYDRYGERYMDLPHGRSGGRDRDGYASEGGRYRSRRHEPPSGPPSRRRHRDDWLSEDPYARRGGGGGRGGYGSDRGSRRRPRYDYSSDEDYDYPSRRRGGRGGGRRGYDDYYDDDFDRSPPRRRRAPVRRAPGQRLLDEDLLRELAEIRYEFAMVERDRIGSAHLYLIDRSDNPADRMARAVAKSEGPLPASASVDQYGNGVGSEIGLDIDQARLTDEDEEVWADTRSRFSRFSKSTRASRQAPSMKQRSRATSSRDSITSNATAKLRSSASLPAGHLRGLPKRQLDTFAEEDEYEEEAQAANAKDADARSIRSVRTTRSERSRKSTRAERERDEYLARQERMEAQKQAAAAAVEDGVARSEYRAPRPSSRLALGGGSERGGARSARQSMDSKRERLPSDFLSPTAAEPGSRRGSMDSRRVSAVRSQPNMRSRFSAQPNGSVRGALAQAAMTGDDDDDDEEYHQENHRRLYDEEDRLPQPRRPDSRSAYRMLGGGGGGRRRADGVPPAAAEEYGDIDDLVPPIRAWDAGSTYSDRSSIRSSGGPASPRRRMMGRPEEQVVPQSPSSPAKRSLFGRKKSAPNPKEISSPLPPASPARSGFMTTFGNHSSPSLRRLPAPEDADYDWQSTTSKRNSSNRSPKQKIQKGSSIHNATMTKKPQRQWHSTIAEDYYDDDEIDPRHPQRMARHPHPQSSHWEADEPNPQDKKGFFGKIFGRKK